ncbi:MAG: hypothetical protein AAGE59_33570 [Cyanobacteria bacterium P01_F01_bin.86]
MATGIMVVLAMVMNEVPADVTSRYPSGAINYTNGFIYEVLEDE